MPTASIAHPSVLALVLKSGPVVQFVLVILLLASILSWAIIFAKSRALKRVSEDDRQFLLTFRTSVSLEDLYRLSGRYPSSSAVSVFKYGFDELKRLPASRQGSSTDGYLEILGRALARASSQEIAELERHIGWLATIASASPFIGLFGTVWGIMNSFQEIGAAGSANLAVVAPGISEALIATATGLAAAIPAVVAYNHFAGAIRRVAVDLDCFAQDFLNLAQRNLLDGKGE